MSLIKEGTWTLTEDGWKWIDDNRNLDDDGWDS